LCCLSVVLSECLSAVGDLTKKSNQPISMTLGDVTGPTNYKNWLIFGVAAVPDTDSGSLFYFSHRCRVEEFRRFISISPADFFTVLGKMTDTNKRMNPQHFGINPADSQI